MKTTTKSIKGFTVVKPNTNKAKTILYFYRYCNKGTSIFEAYQRPSHAKVVAKMYCDELATKYNATERKIVAANSMIFTYCFTFYKKNKRTGEIKHYIAYITKNHNYLLEA